MNGANMLSRFLRISQDLLCILISPLVMATLLEWSNMEKCLFIKLIFWNDAKISPISTLSSYKIGYENTPKLELSVTDEAAIL